MPPFRYDPYDSRPYVGSIADVIRLKGEIPAEALRRNGQIQGRAAEQQGAIWGNAIQGITQAAVSVPGQIHDLRMAKVNEDRALAQTAEIKAQADQRAEGVERAKRVAQQQKYIDDIMQSSLRDDPETGVSTFDRQKFEQGLIQGGNGHLYPELAETLDKLDASASKRNTESRAMLSDALVGVAKAGYTQQAALSGAAYLKKNRVIGDDQLQPLLESLADDPSPENVKRVIDGFGQNLKGYQDYAANEEKRQADLAHTKAQTAELNAKAAVPVAPKVETRSLDVQAADALARGDRATYDRLLKVKKEMGQADDKPRVDPVASQDRQGLVDAVIANPTLFDQITPSEKGRIAAELNKRGFTGFGKPLPPAAVKQIAESKTAVDSLKDLRQVLTENEQYIGPIAGLQGLNPYSDAKKAQAKIDLVRQRVGKALEGGVLRKEDEEKYKQILATLRDTPETAVTKVDFLIQSIENDATNFINEQRLSGRRVNTDVSNRATTTADPRLVKAAEVLATNGHANDPASVALFLKNNPGFK